MSGNDHITTLRSLLGLLDQLKGNGSSISRLHTKWAAAIAWALEEVS